MSHDVRAEIYDHFQDFVSKKLRDSDNPDVTLKDFDKLPPAGVTHFEVPLENLLTTKKKHYVLIEDFMPGAFLKSRPNVVDGTMVSVAYLPFKRHSGSNKSSHSRHVNGPNFSFWISIYLLLWMLSLFGAVIYTQRQDWPFLFK